MVDGELLFFFAQLFPDTLRLGDVLFGELQDVVVVVPVVGRNYSICAKAAPSSKTRM